MAPSDPSNDKALLQCLQGDLRRLAPVLEQVVGALRAVQSSIDEDKRIAVASATVWHEVKVASALSFAQAMLAGLGQNDCAAPSGMRTSLCRPLWVVLVERIDKPARRVDGTLQHPLPRHDGPL